MSVGAMLDDLLASAERRVANGTGSLLVAADAERAPMQTVMLRLLDADGNPWGSAYFDRADRAGRFTVMVEEQGSYSHGELDFAPVEAVLVRAVALAQRTDGADATAHDAALAQIRVWAPPPPPAPLAAPSARPSLGDELHRVRGAGPR